MTVEPRIEELLRERARRLAVPRELIDKSVQRCIRDGLRRTERMPGSGSSTRPTIAAEPDPAPAEPPPTGQPAQPQATVLSFHDGGTAAGGPSAEPAAAGALQPGQIIAGYRIDAQLGAGGMGQVYRATQLSMGRPVAFKVLAPRLAANPRFRERFLREARNAGKVHHPRLIAVHDVGEANGLMFFSMELVDGGSLKGAVQSEGRIDPVRAAAWMRQTLEGLAFAHARGVIHRDIKPDNLMLTAEGTVKIADLGLSRDTGGHGEDAFTTQAGLAMGTPHYMAPEQGRDAHAADHRADLWAVGATWYHLVYGEPPFDGTSPMAVMLAASSRPLVIPDQPAVAAPYAPLIARLLAKDPAHRPPTAEAALAMLDAIAAGQALPGPAPHPHHPRRGPGAGAWIGLGLAAACIAAFVWFAVDQLGKRQTREREDALVALVERRIATMQFPAALQAVADAREADPPHRAAFAPRLDELHAQSAAAWDAWALPLAQPSIDRARARLQERRFKEVQEVLSGIDAKWRSPGVTVQIERLQAEAWSIAEQGSPAVGPGVERRQELMPLLAITPPTAARLDGRSLELSGEGRLSLGPYAERMAADRGTPRMVILPLRLKVRGDAVARLDLGAGASIEFRKQGLSVHGVGSARIQATGHEQTLVLTRIDGSWIVRQPGAPGSRIGETVLRGDGPPMLAWKAGDAAERRITLDLSPRPGPPAP